VPDYSKEEILQDANAVDWDQAFGEVEHSEQLKKERVNKEREAAHNE